MTDTMQAVATTKQDFTRMPQRDLLDFGTIAEVMKFAEMIQHANGAIPKRLVGKAGEIVATVMAGHELGIGPMASLRAFHVVEGNPCAHYSFWIARLKSAGYKVEWPLLSAEKVTLTLTAPDGTSVTDSWDKAKAVTAGLWNSKDNWKKYPQTMLQARLVTSLGRSFAGEVMYCAYEVDEAEEMLKDAIVGEIRSEVSTGTAPQRAAAAAGSAVSKDDAAHEARARECADMAKALGLGRPDVFDLFKELSIEHTETTRISELSAANLDKLAERLDAEAKLRSEGSAAAAADGGEAQS